MTRSRRDLFREHFSSSSRKSLSFRLVVGLPIVALVVFLNSAVTGQSFWRVALMALMVILLTQSLNLCGWWIDRRAKGIDELAMEQERKEAMSLTRCRQCGISLRPNSSHCHWCGWDAPARGRVDSTQSAELSS